MIFFNLGINYIFYFTVYKYLYLNVFDDGYEFWILWISIDVMKDHTGNEMINTFDTEKKSKNA